MIIRIEMKRMQSTFKLLVALFMLVALPACNCQKANTEVVEADKKEASMIVVNVLDKEFYDECHIKGSIQVAFDNVEEYFKNIDRNTPIVTYCSNYACTASGFVAQMLTDMGFKNVKAFEGGMAQWYQKGYPVEGTCKGGTIGSKSSYLTMENNPSGEEEAGVVVVSVDDLHQEMEKAGLL